MNELGNPNCVYRFGLYELDRSTGELRKDGRTRPRLQGQPLEVLLYLLDRPGDVVTRDELRLLLWPVDTFVDYDHSLNAAMNKVREALSDSAENPRFIQTIPRRGYRFIASVEVLANGVSRLVGPDELASLAATTAGNATTSVAAGSTTEVATTPSASGLREKLSLVLSDAQDLPDAPRGVVQFLFSLIQVMYLGFYVTSLGRAEYMMGLLSHAVQHPKWLVWLVLGTALVGIPVRLYLLSAAIFGYRGLSIKFLYLFPFVFPLDELWALAPFLLVDEIGVGLALAATAALLYLPFSQRSLMLMGVTNPTTHTGNL